MRHFYKIFSIFMIMLAFSGSLFALEMYKESGTASFYGKDFHGKKTSNGETFNMNDLTCANKVLPFNTILKVTNQKNNKSVEVRVNDRGPFVLGRDIDLSTQAAKDLGMTKDGLADVTIEIVQLGPDTKLSRDTAASAKKLMEGFFGKLGSAECEPYIPVKAVAKTTPAVKETKKTEAVSEGKLWDIQVASFSNKENARKYAKILSGMGFENIVFQTTKKGIVRVVISKVPDEKLSYTTDKLFLKGYRDYIVRERKN